MCDIAGLIVPYLLTLANINDPISVATFKVAKATTIVAVACRCRQRYHLKYNANVHKYLVVLPKVAEASTVMCHNTHHYMSMHIAGVIALTFANGNTA